MDLLEAIKNRHSVRTFTGAMPAKEVMGALRSKLSESDAGNFRIALVDTSLTGNIGSYGVIKQAPAWLALVTDGSDESALKCAMEAEKIVLYLTSVNIGTCWIAGTFNRTKVKDALSLKDNEQVVAVIPLGMAAGRRRLIESIQTGLMHSSSRKPFDKLFKVDKNAPEAYTTVLDAVRLAPSAMNVQPWRISVDDNGKAIFYSATNNKYTMLDMGIALAHFVVAAEALNIKGRLAIAMPPTPANIAQWIPAAK